MNWHHVLMFWLAVGGIGSFAVYIWGLAFFCCYLEEKYGDAHATAIMIFGCLMPISLLVGLIK